MVVKVTSDETKPKIYATEIMMTGGAFDGMLGFDIYNVFVKFNQGTIASLDGLYYGKEEAFVSAYNAIGKYADVVER